ncbi:3-keto-5-aminohexanoate cleavage protein [Micromonosporaceae bacterium Da 78-11]
MIRRIKACLNGARSFPGTPAELAAEATGAVGAGAEALHLHPRDADGRESLAAVDIAAAVAAVRTACPGVPIGVSTGLWMTGGDVRRRAALISEWGESTVRPDFASVNVGEPGFAELAGLLGAAGIGVEAGVWTPAEVDAVLGLPLERVLIEIIGTPAVAAVPAADAILARLDAVGYTGERLLHGEEESCWPLIAHAGRLGLPTRIGLEDTLVRPDGTPATSNADLVRHGLAGWTAARQTGANPCSKAARTGPPVRS